MFFMKALRQPTDTLVFIMFWHAPLKIFPRVTRPCAVFTAFAAVGGILTACQLNRSRKKLGFTNKQQIEAYGIDKFNALCRESAFSYIKNGKR